MRERTYFHYDQVQRRVLKNKHANRMLTEHACIVRDGLCTDLLSAFMGVCCVCNYVAQKKRIIGK